MLFLGRVAYSSIGVAGSVCFKKLYKVMNAVRASKFLNTIAIAKNSEVEYVKKMCGKRAV